LFIPRSEHLQASKRNRKIHAQGIRIQRNATDDPSRDHLQDHIAILEFLRNLALCSLPVGLRIHIDRALDVGFDDCQATLAFAQKRISTKHQLHIDEVVVDLNLLKVAVLDPQLSILLNKFQAR